MSQITITLSDKADALIAQLQKEIFNRRRKKVSAAGVIETLVESGAKSQSDKRFATSWTNLVADIEKAAKVADAHGSKPTSLTDAEWAIVLSHRTRSGAEPSPGRRRASTKAPTAVKKPITRKPAAVAKSVPAKSTTAKATTTKSAPVKATAVKGGKAKASTTKRATAPSTAAPAKTAKAALKKPASRKSPTSKTASPVATAPLSAETAKASTTKAAIAKPSAKTASTTSAKTTGKAAPKKGSPSSVAQRMAKAVTRLGSAGGVAPSPNGITAAKGTPATSQPE
jgi:hypothetical protein